MLHELFAKNPSGPVVLSMVGSVGAGGTNRSDDTVLVQRLLNAVGPAAGGPAARLAEDGKVGPKTVAAITRYQQTVLGFADGRVDPRGRTVRTLVNDLQVRGVVPLPAPGLATAPRETVAAFRGTGLPAAPPAAGNRLAVGGFGAPFTATSWKIESSTTIDASVRDRGAFVATLVLLDEATNARHTVSIKAILVGASLGLPAGLDFSLPSFPSVGGRVFRGLLGVGPISKSSFVGLVGVSLAGGNTGGLGVGPGAGVTFYQFGWAPGPPGTFTAAAAVAGVQGGLPGLAAASGLGVSLPG